MLNAVSIKYPCIAGTNLMMLSGEAGCFVLNHFQGTSPVKYNTSGWVKACRENPITRVAGVFLIDSNK